MNTDDPDTEDQALRTLLRPALTELIGEATARSSSAPPWSTSPERDVDVIDIAAGSSSSHDVRRSSDTAGVVRGRQRLLAFAAVTVLLIAGAVVGLRGRGQSVRSGTTTSVGQPTTTSDLDTEPLPPVGGDSSTLGSLFPEAAFSGAYAVIDPSITPEFEGLRPVTDANVNRWLTQQFGAELHWMVPADIATSDASAPSFFWRGPVEAPPDWLIVPNSDPAWASEGGGSTRTIQTRDGTWVEVSWLLDQPSSVDEWLSGLGSLPTATDITPPDGYVSVPQGVEEIGLRYSLADLVTQAASGTVGTADAVATVADSGEGEEEEPWLDLITIRFDRDIDDTEALNSMSRFGRPDLVDSFRGEGELYRLVDRGPQADVPGPYAYYWQPGPRTLVWIRAAEGVPRDQIERYLGAVALSDSVEVELDATYNFSDEPPDIAAEVADVRSGDFGSYRFVYLQTRGAAGNEQGDCALLAVGGPFPWDTCQPMSAGPAAATCVYSVDPAREVLRGEHDGYVLTLVVDANVADRVNVTHGGGDARQVETREGSSTDDDSTDSSAVTEATIAEPVVESGPEPTVADGTPVETVDITGDSGGDSWVAKSARLQSVPTVTGDGVECTQMN